MKGGASVIRTNLHLGRVMRSFRRKTLKNLALTFFPNAALRIMSSRSRSLIEHQTRQLRLDDLAHRTAQLTGKAVYSGPFAGTKLAYDALPVHSAPKLLGSYEKEIWPFIEDVILWRPDNVLN